MQASVSVPIGWGSHHSEGLNFEWLLVTHNIVRGHDYPHNYGNKKNHKLICGQDAPGSLQKGRTINNIKNMDLNRVEKEI